MAVGKENNNDEILKSPHLCLFYSERESFRNIFRECRFLKSLMVIGQNDVSLEGVEMLSSLEELWLVECNLTQEVISPLGECVGLKRLYLYDNQLTALPDLSNLKKLSHLWLSHNQIESLENINSLSSVKELYISNNNIKKIDVQFKTKLNIACLNLSGNPISAITEFQKLAALPKLQWLLMTDPLYRRSPVTLLAHFRSYVVRSLPNLQGLDTIVISPAERKHAMEFYETKIQYYRLAFHNAIATLNNSLKSSLESQTKELEMIKSALHTFGNLDNKAGDKSSSYTFWECEANRWMERRELCLQNFVKLRQVVTQTLQLELVNSGNIQFKQIDLAESKMKNDFKKRFHLFLCPQLQDRIIDVNILSVWSVHGPCNTTVLQSQFKDIFENVYIMYPVEDLSTKPLQLIEELLFGNCQEGREVWMSSCLAAADPLVTDSTSVHRQLLLRSHTLLAWRTLLLCGVPQSASVNQVGSSLHNSPSSQCQLFSLPHPSALVPLYLVTFQYNFQDYFKPLKVSCRTATNTSLRQCLAGLPTQQNITKLVLSSADIHQLDIPTMEHVISVDLSHNHLQNLSAIGPAFPKLTSLSVAFNQINTLDSLKSMKGLTQLVVKWNVLTEFLPTLKKLKDFSSLKQLDLSWNPFTDVVRSDHQQCLVCRHLTALQSYCGLPLPRSLASGQVTLHGKSQFPLLPTWKGPVQPLTLRWMAAMSAVEEGGNHLGVTGNEIISITLRGLKLAHFRSVFTLRKLKWLDLSDNLISGPLTLKTHSTLEEVNLSHNLVEGFSCPSERFKYLTKLDLSHNCLTSLTAFTTQAFPNLKLLDLSHNHLQTLAGLSGLKYLEEAYLSNNQLQDCEDLVYCRQWQNLAAIDLSYNPLTLNPTFRQNCLYHLSSLKYINGSKVLPGELKSATQLFGGKLDQDYLARVYSGAMINKLTHLNLSNCSIKQVVLPNISLVNVTTITLDHNKLSSLSWVQAFPRLVRLSLSHNHVSCFSDQPTSSEPCPSLRSLSLDHNHIRNLVHLRLDLFPNLAVLILNDNEITTLAGLRNKTKLERLVLDRNKLSSIPLEHTDKLENLLELYLERNWLTKLDFIRPLKKLQKLFVGFNKLVTKTSLAPLGDLPCLQELTVHGNPICRQLHGYRDYLPRIPSLLLLEGHPVSNNNS